MNEIFRVNESGMYEVRYERALPLKKKKAPKERRVNAAKKAKNKAQKLARRKNR